MEKKSMRYFCFLLKLNLFNKTPTYLKISHRKNTWLNSSEIIVFVKFLLFSRDVDKCLVDFVKYIIQISHEVLNDDNVGLSRLTRAHC